MVYLPGISIAYVYPCEYRNTVPLKLSGTCIAYLAPSDVVPPHETTALVLGPQTGPVAAACAGAAITESETRAAATRAETRFL